MKQGNLRRLLAPRSVAVVGASETLPMARNIVLPLLNGSNGVRPGSDSAVARPAVHLVNPRRSELFGVATHADLAAIGQPVDAVVSLVNAELTVDVVRQAAGLGCGGVVAIAGGFGESGERGQTLQAQLLQAAESADMALLGPNCAGYMNVGADTWLFTGARLPVQPGGIAVVSQSGFFTRAAFAAGLERRLGFSYGVSSGNEAVCGLADYLDFLSEDEGTRVICLVIEKIRDARRFFAAAHRARQCGKPIIALKLGRSHTGRAISQSHTGALADAAWTYEVALRQAGMLLARDIDDLLDQAQLFEQLPARAWKPLPRVAVITTSGGVAAHAADLCEAEGVALPVPPGIEAWVREHLPEAGVVNPIDMTGFAVGKAELTAAMFDRYAEAYDAVVLAWWTGEHDEEWARRLTAPFMQSAERHPGTVMLLTAAHGGAMADWAVGLRPHNVQLGRGLAAAARAIGAMHRYLSQPPARPPAPRAASVPRPGSLPLITPQGLLLPFEATMLLLRRFGVAVAPYVLLDDADDRDLSALGSSLVVKLANVAHRTEHGAVKVGVPPAEVAAVAEDLRYIARRDGLDAQVVVQALAPGDGELFVGLQGTNDLGPVLVCGLGGVFVELLNKISGRMLPIDLAGADALLEEAAGRFLAGFRAQAPWHRGALRQLLLGVGELGLECGDWVASLDLNPVICSAHGCVVVDAVCLLKE